MAQINLHTTPEFEAALETMMKERGIRTKSEAIRVAVAEAAAKREKPRRRGDLSAFIGLVDRFGGNTSGKTGAELEAEIDVEMDEELDRSSRHR